MKVLITGDRGFVGQATRRLLEAHGHVVYGYDVADGSNITNEYDLGQAIDAANPDRILHLCAVARFADADKDPITAFEVNVLGTRNVAEAAQKRGIPLVHASTGSVYMPVKQPMPITEEYPVGGNSIYGCGKAVAEKYVQRMTSPWMILRYGHLYGAEKVGHGLIGGFLDAINNGRNPKLFGGNQTNDFMYIDDVARANQYALECSLPPGKSAWGETYNIGTGVELSAHEAGGIVCETFGYSGPVDMVPQRAVDPDRFVLEVSKARRLLGFDAEYDFRTGLEKMKQALVQRAAA
jgi:nucleoside-diphosphate-sugar epimerase